VDRGLRPCAKNIKKYKKINKGRGTQSFIDLAAPSKSDRLALLNKFATDAQANDSKLATYEKPKIQDSSWL